MSELIKSILVFQKVADHGRSSFCTLTRGTNARSLPCHMQDGITCTHCMFATTQRVKPTIQALQRVCEKPE